jgi:hypothetical protein
MFGQKKGETPPPPPPEPPRQTAADEKPRRRPRGLLERSRAVLLALHGRAGEH